jgi:hypothetical protein
MVVIWGVMSVAINAISQEGKGVYVLTIMPLAALPVPATRVSGAKY